MLKSIKINFLWFNSHLLSSFCFVYQKSFLTLSNTMKIVINLILKNKFLNKKCILITIVISSMFSKNFMSNFVWLLKKKLILLWIFIESTIFALFLFSSRIYAFFAMSAKIFSKSKMLAFIFATFSNKTK